MIIAQLTGDLGNQMFQYALGRRLSIIHRTALKLDIADFETSPHHYRLDRFCIHASIAEKREINQLVNLHLLRHADQTNFQHLFAARTNIEENPSLTTLQNDTYLIGDCWTLRYFNTISESLHNELKVKTPPTGRNKKYFCQIAKENAVSIYLSRNTATNSLSPLSMNYYDRAAKYMANRLKRPVFYLFSDDPAWCKMNFSLSYPFHLIDYNDCANQFEDFRLMASCKHHIIANSAISWWAAWLNRNKKKIVVSPQKWFDDGQGSDDILPEHWIKLENEVQLN